MMIPWTVSKDSLKLGKQPHPKFKLLSRSNKSTKIKTLLYYETQLIYALYMKTNNKKPVRKKWRSLQIDILMYIDYREIVQIK